MQMSHGRVLVTGGSHSGGNWAVEIVRASQCFKFTQSIEDRALFLHPLWPGYATKLAIGNPGLYWSNLRKLMNEYHDLKVVFMTRHPVDTCLSKIIRGHPELGDGRIDHPWDYPWDCTMKGSVVSMEVVHELFCRLFESYRERCLWVRMEDLITDTSEVCRTISRFLGVECKEEMFQAHGQIQNQYQQARYGGKIQGSQVNMWERWDTIHDGFFKGHPEIVAYLWEFLLSITQYWEYPIR